MKPKIKMICKDCGKEAAIDKEKSNENWNVYKTKCDECQGNIITKLE